jgi:O-antigen/teichoic acid export membrane protein
MMLVRGIFLALNYWNTRTKHFSHLSIARVASALTNTSGSLGTGFASHATGGALIIAQLGGQAVAATLLGGQIWRGNGRFIFRNLSWRKIRANAKRYRHFPIYSTWTAFLNSSSLHFAPLALAALYGAPTAGLYALTLRVLGMPSSLLGNAIGTAFLSRAPAARRDGQLAALIQGIHRKLTILGIPPLAVLLFAGPDLFSLVFGEQWNKAGQYAQWMAPWIYLQFQWSPLSTIVTVLELQKEALISQVLTFSCRLASLIFCAWIGSKADTAVLVFAVVSAFAYLFRQLWFTRRAGVRITKLLKNDIMQITLFAL